MNDKDLERAAAIIKDHEQGTLTDLRVVAVLAMVRAEATDRERARLQHRLEQIAATYTAQGRADIAFALASAARSTVPPMALGAPTVGDVADA